MEIINDQIGENDASFNVASIDPPTCKDCSSSSTCLDNILSSVINMKYLTSGYFKGKSSQLDEYSNQVLKPDGRQKCSHGGFLDNSRSISPIDGINKDTYLKFDSPHYYYHSKAAQLALRSSFDFLQRIREAVNDDSIFGRFLGRYQGSSLTFVIDTTGSMGSYIEGAKDSSMTLIDKWIADGHAASDFILVPFNDPNFGPLKRTTNSSLFKQWISSLSAGGGGDLPEMCYSGLKLAVGAALPGTPIHFIQMHLQKILI